jgi:hypothetical protein
LAADGDSRLIDQCRSSHDYEDIKRSGTGIDAVPASKNSPQRLQLRLAARTLACGSRSHIKDKSRCGLIQVKEAVVEKNSSLASVRIELARFGRSPSCAPRFVPATGLVRASPRASGAPGRPRRRRVRDVLALDDSLASLAVEDEAHSEDGLAWRCVAGRASATRRPRGWRRGSRGQRGRRPSPGYHVSACIVKSVPHFGLGRPAQNAL